jgi:exosortase N
MTVLFLVESRIGKLGYLPLILIAICSPVIKYLATIFTFPLRLAWSNLAAQVISIFEKNVEVHGNIFVLNGNAFSVDPECLGLNMIITGLILVCLLLAFAERKYKISFSLPQLLLTFSMATVLILLANFFRILCLVMFRSMPETMSHEIIGLVCLGLYVLVPVYFWIKWLSKKASLSSEMRSMSPPRFPHFSLLREASGQVSLSNSLSLSLSLFLLLVITLLNQNWKSYTIPESFGPLAQIEVPGMKKVSISEGIAHFESDSLLLYIKQPTRFWGADHTPAICWMGSGYTFAAVEKQQIAGQEVFLGKLKMDDKRLYTAWWYDNGVHRTTSQWDWRWRSAQGEKPFYLWNLTGETEAGLRGELETWFTPPPSHPKMSVTSPDTLPAAPFGSH